MENLMIHSKKSEEKQAIAYGSEFTNFFIVKIIMVLKCSGKNDVEMLCLMGAI